jgi:GDP-D-mannose dehydratase
VLASNEAKSKSGCINFKMYPRCVRIAKVKVLRGDLGETKQEWGWMPDITAQAMRAEMVATGLAQAKHALLKKHGYDVNVSVE